MMKYFAVILDSFREALASRVLWLVLAVITLFLLAIAPMGYREEVTWKLGDQDVRTWQDFMVKLREEGPADKFGPSTRIWKLLDDDVKKKLSTVKIPGKDQDAVNPWGFLGLLSQFKKSLNTMLERPDFHDPSAWKSVQLVSRELRQLQREKPEKLVGRERARFNRLLLEAAYPDLIRSSPPTSIQLVYAWYDLGPPQPLRGTTLRDYVQSAAAWVMKWFVGAIGVFVAILVTAPIIPQMFDPGSLHLLLSKPIRRWLLFLAKYLGGCAFILIAATYLIGGVWLVLGARFGVWDSTLLMSIPVYLFVFAIYYAVSALSGVIWRSPIVCIAVSIMFFATCWLVGTAKSAFERMIWDKMRVVRLLEAKETLFAVDEVGIVYRWEAKGSEWKETFVSDAQKQMRGIMLLMPVVPNELKPVGPVYDAAGDRLLSAQPSFPPGKSQLCVGERKKQWESEVGTGVPIGTLALLSEANGSVLAVSSMDMQRLQGDPLKKAEPVKIFGVALPSMGNGAFRSVGPDPPVILTQPAAVALNSNTGDLALYTRGALMLLRREANGRYARKAEIHFRKAERQPVVMGFGGETLLVGREDGRIQVFDPNGLKPIVEFQPEGRNAPRFLVPSRDGRTFAAVFHNKTLWSYDVRDHQFSKPEIAGQGEITTAAFSSDNKLLVADRGMRVSEYLPPSMRLERRFAPQLGLLANAYRYGVLPVYTVCPKPGELDTTFEYLLSRRETRKDRDDDLSAAQQVVDPWTPLWSSAAFMCIVLLFACVYIEWQDF
jgi:ABC-type transport system involved in multi-copper enzyme maturation permease subunit